jgi:transposase
MSPEYVRPYVKAQKNGDRDAEAIAEAATRPTMRFVELKSEEQLDVQTLHRVRDRLVGERTSLTNQIRSLLLERGHIVAQGHARLRRLLAGLLDSGTDELSSRMVFCSGTCARDGTNWITVSQPLTLSSQPWLGPMSGLFA